MRREGERRVERGGEGKRERERERERERDVGERRRGGGEERVDMEE